MMRVLVLLALGSGCATLGRTERATVFIVSEPVGAEVVENGIVKGQTPLAYEMSRTDPEPLTIQRSGYRPETCTFRREVDPQMVVFDLFLLLPVVVDAMTGRWFNVAPSACFVSLTPDGPVVPKTPVISDEAEHDPTPAL